MVVSVIFRVRNPARITPRLSVIQAEIELIAGASADQDAIARPKQNWEAPKLHLRRDQRTSLPCCGRFLYNNLSAIQIDTRTLGLRVRMPQHHKQVTIAQLDYFRFVV